MIQEQQFKIGDKVRIKYQPLAKLQTIKSIEEDGRYYVTEEYRVTEDLLIKEPKQFKVRYFPKTKERPFGIAIIKPMKEVKKPIFVFR